MPARIKARAVIWVEDKIAVNKMSLRGGVHITLPGGRVNERESVVDALRREVLEELGIEINVGDLMFAAEVFSSTPMQDIELVFAAEPVTPTSRTALELVDPRDPEFPVLPPVLDYIAAWRDGTLKYQWLGNIFNGQLSQLSAVVEK